MTIRLKRKYLMRAPDDHARNKPVKGGRGSNHGSGNSGRGRRWQKGVVHPIGLSGATCANRRQS